MIGLQIKFIYKTIASKTLTLITSKLGTKTAGVGVTSIVETWYDMLLEASFKVIAHLSFYSFGNLSQVKIRLLPLKDQNVVLLIARKE